MAITPEEKKKMFEERFREYPRLGYVAAGKDFGETLKHILDFTQVSPEYFPIIENEVLVILSLYAPVNELGANIQESTGLTEEVSNSLTALIRSLILAPVIDDLEAFNILWDAEIEKAEKIPEAPKDWKEKLELRPEGVPQSNLVNPDSPKPLTREEVLRALSPHRTMAGDIASLQEVEVNKSIGYDAGTEVKKQNGEA